MKSVGVGLSLLVVSALGQSETDARTYLTLGGHTQPTWFICDDLEAPTVTVVGKPTAANQVRITRFSKANPVQYSGQVYTLGRPDPGAGQVYYSLSLAGKEVGFVHATNPGMLEHPGLAYT